MALTPQDIHNRDFKRRLRGYDPDDVDEFLDKVIVEFESVLRENTALKEQIEQLAAKIEQYQSLEDTLNRTLIVAQETADELKAVARKEADLIIQEARLQAERIVEGGQSRVRRVMEQKDEIEQVVLTLRSQVRSILMAQLQMLDHSLPLAEGYRPEAEASAAVLVEAVPRAESLPEVAAASHPVRHQAATGRLPWEEDAPGLEEEEEERFGGI